MCVLFVPRHSNIGGQNPFYGFTALTLVGKIHLMISLVLALGAYYARLFFMHPALDLITNFLHSNREKMVLQVRQGIFHQQISTNARGTERRKEQTDEGTNG